MRGDGAAGRTDGIGQTDGQVSAAAPAKARPRRGPPVPAAHPLMTRPWGHRQPCHRRSAPGYGQDTACTPPPVSLFPRLVPHPRADDPHREGTEGIYCQGRDNAGRGSPQLPSRDELMLPVTPTHCTLPCQAQDSVFRQGKNPSTPSPCPKARGSPSLLHRGPAPAGGERSPVRHPRLRAAPRPVAGTMLPPGATTRRRPGPAPRVRGNTGTGYGVGGNTGTGSGGRGQRWDWPRGSEEAPGPDPRIAGCTGTGGRGTAPGQTAGAGSLVGTPGAAPTLAARGNPPGPGDRGTLPSLSRLRAGTGPDANTDGSSTGNGREQTGGLTPTRGAAERGAKNCSRSPLPVLIPVPVQAPVPLSVLEPVPVSVLAPVPVPVPVPAPLHVPVQMPVLSPCPGAGADASGCSAAGVNPGPCPCPCLGPCPCAGAEAGPCPGAGAAGGAAGPGLPLPPSPSRHPRSAPGGSCRVPPALPGAAHPRPRPRSPGPGSRDPPAPPCIPPRPPHLPRRAPAAPGRAGGAG
ncbi:basic proline-rich protein-like [Corvus kubaryi]|uniref:basic proline-rich protein-like n=1 Tax=Corvus kubaryi TaxID=68294 RepID=UPI001C046209|nr:basic proline-rich protein-like [Corvus kubaryi]